MSNILYEISSKEERKSTSPFRSNKDEDISGKDHLEPKYDTSEFKNSHYQVSSQILEKSRTKSKRKSRSKNRRISYESRKETKNSSQESKKNSKHFSNGRNKRSIGRRPFSGGNKNSQKDKKTDLKVEKPKVRPKTSKGIPKKLVNNCKSPKNTKVFSPISSKKDSVKFKKPGKVSKGTKGNSLLK